MARLGRSAKGAGALLVALSLLAAIPAATVSAAVAEPPCVVTDTTADPHVSFDNLGVAFAAAQTGARLTVRGVCHGYTVIARDITIVGIKPKRKPLPVLDGDASGSVITVTPGATVTIERLVITDGSGTPGSGGTYGGAISNEGTLTLRDVVVRGNVSADEGAISNEGTLTLAGTTTVSGNVGTSDQSYAGGIANWSGATLTIGDRSVIRGNTGGYGGGLYNQGTVVLEGEASIRSNHATESGGGVYNEFAGDITLRDSASIHHNRSDLDAGGIANDFGATLTLEDSSSIHHNRTPANGGGVWNHNGGSLTLRGSSSIHHNRAVAGGGVLNAAPSTLTLAGSASVHHNRTLTWGGGIWNNGSLTLAGSSSVHHNRSDGHASGIYTYGPTLLSGDASVHDNDSHATRNSGAIEIPGFGQVFTMEDASSVSDNIGGRRGGGIVLWPACGTPAVLTGAAERTSGNTPGQIVTRMGTGAICD